MYKIFTIRIQSCIVISLADDGAEVEPPLFPPWCPVYRCAPPTCPENVETETLIDYDGCQGCPTCVWTQPEDCPQVKCAVPNCNTASQVQQYTKDGRCRLCTTCPPKCTKPECDEPRCNNAWPQFDDNGCRLCPKCQQDCPWMRCTPITCPNGATPVPHWDKDGCKSCDVCP